MTFANKTFKEEKGKQIKCYVNVRLMLEMLIFAFVEGVDITVCGCSSGQFYYMDFSVKL